MITNAWNLLLTDVNQALKIGRLDGDASGVNPILVLCIAGEDSTIGGYGIAYYQLSYTTWFFYCSVPVVANGVVITHPADTRASNHLATKHDLITLVIVGF